MTLNYYEPISQESEEERRERVDKMESKDDVVTITGLQRDYQLNYGRAKRVKELIEAAERRGAVKALKELLDKARFDGWYTVEEVEIESMIEQLEKEVGGKG